MLRLSADAQLIRCTLSVCLLVIQIETPNLTSSHLPRSKSSTAASRLKPPPLPTPAHTAPSSRLPTPFASPSRPSIPLPPSPPPSPPPNPSLPVTSSSSPDPSDMPPKPPFYPSASTSLSPSHPGTTLTYHVVTGSLALLALIPTQVYETRRGLVEYNVVWFREGVQEICAVEKESRGG